MKQGRKISKEDLQKLAQLHRAFHGYEKLPVIATGHGSDHRGSGSTPTRVAARRSA